MNLSNRRPEKTTGRYLELASGLFKLDDGVLCMRFSETGLL